MSPKRILIVDDDAAVVDYLCESLAKRGMAPTGSVSATQALAMVRDNDFDLVLSDVEMPELRGVDLLHEVLQAKPTQLVLLMTAYGSVEMAVAAVQAGACDFVTKPFQIESLLHAIDRALSARMLKREVVRLRAALNSVDSSPSVIAHSSAMRRVLNLAERAAGSDSSVFITGETGSGKSVLARFLHDKSARRAHPFLQLNCAALPPALAESELFGVRRGAFTDARESRDGLFLAAGKGTLFLDELGELSLEAQAKLLQVLERKTVRPLGGTQEAVVEARVVAATNRSPEELLRTGCLRPDLYYRINVVRIEVPPLRERKDDILPLVDLLLTRLQAKSERPILGVSAPAIRQLLHYPWPGNVRELANVIERAIALADHDVILPEDLDFLETRARSAIDLGPAVDTGMSLDEMERVYIQRVLESQAGNKAAAARILGITRRTLYRKLEEAALTKACRNRK